MTPETITELRRLRDAARKELDDARESGGFRAFPAQRALTDALLAHADELIEAASDAPPPVVWKSAPPKGYVLDCTGDTPVVRKVLGTLPITADGCVIGDIETCSLFNDKGERLDCIGNGMAWGRAMRRCGQRSRRERDYRTASGL